jgi:NADPH:quinone reductase-like Zn-dependent oxidoreductase
MTSTDQMGTGSAVMLAVRLQGPGGTEGLTMEELPVPVPGPGEVLVRVRAAAITRDELDWPTDRLPATPSYELSGLVATVGPAVAGFVHGDEVFALAPFDRDGVAAGFALVPAGVLATKSSSIGHVEAAAVPMGGLSAWQGLFVHGGLEEGQRVLIHGAAGGVGHLAVQLARWRGASVVGTAAGDGIEAARAYGAHEVVDRTDPDGMGGIGPVDLVFDTVGGDGLARAGDALRDGGRIVTVAEEPPEGVAATYFVVEPDGAQLGEIARLVDQGAVRPAIDSVFPLENARRAFERVLERGKRGKVVLEI